MFCNWQQSRTNRAPRPLLAARQVSVTAEGARGVSSTKVCPLSFYVSHPGRSEIVDKAGNRQVYTHLRRYVLHEYDVTNGTVITQVGAYVQASLWDSSCMAECTGAGWS